MEVNYKAVSISFDEETLRWIDQEAKDLGFEEREKTNRSYVVRKLVRQERDRRLAANYPGAGKNK